MRLRDVYKRQVIYVSIAKISRLLDASAASEEDADAAPSEELILEFSEAPEASEPLEVSDPDTVCA